MSGSHRTAEFGQKRSFQAEYSPITTINNRHILTVSVKSLIKKSSAFAFFILIFMSNLSSAQTWATAVSRNEAQGTAIVYRYVKTFPENFLRSQQPDRIIIVWRYQGEKGMPSTKERKHMDDFEDALSPLEKDGFSTLALVSTGDNIKEWTYYTKAENTFLERLNSALRTKVSGS
jgi:hypothetical protein